MASKYNWGDKLLIFLKSYERTPKITREKYYSLLSTDKEVCLLWLFAFVVRQYEMTPPLFHCFSVSYRPFIQFNSYLFHLNLPKGD